MRDERLAALLEEIAELKTVREKVEAMLCECATTELGFDDLTTILTSLQLSILEVKTLYAEEYTKLYADDKVYREREEKYEENDR